MQVLFPLLGTQRRRQIDVVLAYEAVRPPSNHARREWSSRAARRRQRDAKGQFVVADPVSVPLQIDATPLETLLDVGLDTTTSQPISDSPSGSL